MNEKCETKMELQQSPCAENKVFINGQQIHCIRSINLSHGIDSIPKVTIELIPQHVDVTCLGEARTKWAELQGVSTVKENPTLFSE